MQQPRRPASEKVRLGKPDLPLADAIVIAKLDSANSGSILYSLPPIYNSALKLVPDAVVRGPQKKGDAFTAYQNLRQKDRPDYPVGKMCVVVLQLHDKTWTVLLLEVANADNVNEAKAAKAAKAK